MPMQFLWCFRCQTAFAFTGARVERALGGKLAVRHEDCGALNEIAPIDKGEERSGTYQVVGEIETAH